MYQIYFPIKELKSASPPEVIISQRKLSPKGYNFGKSKFSSTTETLLPFFWMVIFPISSQSSSYSPEYITHDVHNK